MPDEKVVDTNCRGSFKVGTACGICERCKSRGYSPEKKEEAIAAEAERTKDLPASGVKDNSQKIVVEVKQPDAEPEKIKP